MYNILITGANGQLGRCIAKNAFTPNLFYIFLDKNKLNITDEETVRQNFEKYKPRVVINCAAYTNVDKAEKDGYQDAFNINAKGPEILARYCKEYDTLLIHISTDYVYDGRLNVPYIGIGGCEPRNKYGETKLKGDENIISSGCKYLIFRVSWLYSNNGNNFYNKIMEKILNNEHEFFSTIDEIASPTNANNFAQVLLTITKKYCNDEIHEKRLSKVYHYADKGLCSRYDFAMAIQDFILEFNGTYGPTHIKPCRKYIFHTPAARPNYTVLDTTETLENLPYFEIYYWRDNLRDEIKKFLKNE